MRIQCFLFLSLCGALKNMVNASYIFYFYQKWKIIHCIEMPINLNFFVKKISKKKKRDNENRRHKPCYRNDLVSLVLDMSALYPCETLKIIIE